eukprot:1526006-Alexandrium_andersonii.AAC.1
MLDLRLRPRNAGDCDSGLGVYASGSASKPRATTAETFVLQGMPRLSELYGRARPIMGGRSTCTTSPSSTYRSARGLPRGA